MIDPTAMLILRILEIIFRNAPALIELIQSDAEITLADMEPIQRALLEEKIRMREGLDITAPNPE